MISIFDLHKNYGKFQVLKGINLTVASGSVLGLVGPNACGKTTLIKCLLGLVNFSQGKINIQNYDTKSGDHYKKMIGYMPQNPDFPKNLKIQEIFQMMADLRDQSPQFKDELIECFSLKKSLEKPFGVLSGGTKQKVASVSALMFDSPVLILDEPTVGLDPLSGAVFKEIVRQRAKKGAAIIIVSHVLSELEQVASDIAFIFEGKVFIKTSLEDLRKKSFDSSLERTVVEIFNERNREET